MKKSKRLVIVFLVVFVLIIPLLYFGIEREQPFTYIGESGCETGTSDYSNCDLPVEAFLCITQRDMIMHQERLRYTFSPNVNYYTMDIIVSYGRKIEQINWVPDNLKIVNLSKEFRVTFSQEYYPDTVFFYFVEKGGNGSGLLYDPYAQCYILSKNGDRFYIGGFHAISSSESIQKILDEEKE